MYWKILFLCFVLLFLLLPVRVPWGRDRERQRRQWRSRREPVPRDGVQCRPPSPDQTLRGCHCRRHFRHRHGRCRHRTIDTRYPPPLVSFTRRLHSCQSYRPHCPFPRLRSVVVVVVIVVIVDGDNVRGKDDGDRVDDMIFLKKSLKLYFFNA